MFEKNDKPLPKKIYLSDLGSEKKINQQWNEETMYKAFETDMTGRELYLHANVVKDLLSDKQYKTLLEKID